MFELAGLLIIGYLGGCFGRVAWLFLSSSVVMIGAPLYLASQMGVANPLALALMTLTAITAIQFGSLAGLLAVAKSRASLTGRTNLSVTTGR